MHCYCLNRVEKLSFIALGKIRQIAWAMWEHRNKYLHECQISIHPTDQLAIDYEMQLEWDLGPSSLPAHYQSYFEGSLCTKQAWKFHRKKCWLHTIWEAWHRSNSEFFNTRPNALEDSTRNKFLKWLCHTKQQSSS